MPELHAIDGEARPDPILQAARQIAEQLPSLRQFYAANALNRHARYRAYVEAGFSPDQAMELIIHDQ